MIHAHRFREWLCAALLLTLCVPAAVAQSGTWVVSWAASQQIPEPQNALPASDLNDATIREIIHLSIGGPTLRVHLSNAFGTAALHFTSVHIAKPLSPASSAIDPTTDKALTFAGKADVIVPPGAEFVSDPIDYSVAALSDLAVSFHLDKAPERQTSHPGSRSTTYYLHGDEVSAPNLPGAKQIDHWYQLSGVDVLSSGKHAAAIVALGDSITDGHASTTNGNDRWTDELARRLQADKKTRNIGVSNQGIGGNHLLTDGLGPNVLARFDRDVLAQAGVKWLIVLEGVNDLGGLTIHHEVSPADHDAFVARILAAYQQIILRAHAHGIRVYGGTITPYEGNSYYHPDAQDEADRQTINAWIRNSTRGSARTPGRFDAVIDFDAAIRDPQQPSRILAAYDCGDHLHPGPAGYKAMADAIPLNLFTK